MRKLKLFLTLLMLMCIGVTQMWGEVVSGTAYTTTSGSFPEGWSKSSSNEQSKYISLYSGDYIQTENFCQNGFTSIVVSARKVGGPSDTEKVITVEWIPENGSDAVVLGTLSPSGTSLGDLTLSELSNTPTANTSGSIKLTCKAAPSGKGSGVGAVTITYTAGTCTAPVVEPFTVTLMDNSATLTEETAGAGVTLPSRDGCEGYTFAGWTKTWTATQSSWTATAPEIIPAGAYTPEADENLYPVYTKVESGSGSASPTTKSMTSFDAISGNVDGDENISYEATQGASSTAPAVNSKQIRIYQNGGLLTITANNGVKITSITIGSAMVTSVSYAVDGGSHGESEAIAKNGTMTAGELNASSVEFKCNGTDKNSRLYLNNLSVTYSGGGSGSTTYYISEPDCSTPTPPAPACELKVTISKGTPEIGSFSLNKEEGAYETCDAAFEVIVTPAVVEHYHVSAVTASNSTSISDPDADGKYTITYAKETNAESEINVTYVEDTKYDVTWSVNGVESTNKAYHGAHPTLPAAPTSSCDETSTTFMGWAAEVWSGKLAAPTATVYTSAEAMPVVEAEGVKYFAVFAKAGEATSVTHTLTISGKDVATTYASHDETDDQGATWHGECNYNDATHIGLNKKSDNHYLGSPLFASNVTSVKATIQNGSSSERYVYLCSSNETAQPSSGDLGSVSVAANADNEELTFTLGETAFKQFYVYVSAPLQFHEFVVTLEGAPSYSDYMTTCCTKYNVNIAEGITNGSVSADVAKACQDAVVTLTVTPATNYHLKTLSVMNGETPVAVTENTFTMPAGNVTISATFEEDACTPLATPEVTVSGKAYPYDAVKLAWTAIDNANLYKVYIYDAEDNELEKDEAFEGVEYTIDLDLEASTTYKYSVQAISNTPAVHCPSVAATGTFATDALPTAHLTLMVNGSEATTLSGDHTILTPFDLPTPAAVAGCPKVFVGWSADADRTTAPEYATGTKYTFANETPATLYAVFAKENAGTEVTYSIDFEADAATYTDWAFNNMVSNYTNSGVTAHGGSKIGSTDGKATASVTTAAKIANPQSITFYVSKQSTNTTESYWKVEVSADGSAWTQVGDAQSATSMSKGTWVEVTRDLSEYSDVYVRVSYGSNTAVRVIDDLVLSAVGSASYSEYGTACEACKTVTLVKAGEDQEKGNTFALKVGDDVVESVQTCEAASVNIVASPATGYQVSFGISELQGASLSENIISLAANTNGELTVTANFTLKNHVVTLAQNPAAGATLVGGKEDAHFGETINLSTDVPTGYEFINWTSESVEITNATSATGASFTMPDADVTITANFGKVYTVSFNVGSDPITETAIGTGVELPAGPALSQACQDDGWDFAGWAEAAVAEQTTTAPELNAAGATYHPTTDIELFAVYKKDVAATTPETKYVKTALTDIADGSEVVITELYSNTIYAAANDGGTSAGPSEIELTETEDVLNIGDNSNIFWTISKDGDNFSFAVKGGTNKLYCTNSNNGVRVGTNENNVFSIKDDYLYNNATSRYVGYNHGDGGLFRCYTSINTNINNETLVFYKATSVVPTTTYYLSAPVCCTKYNISIADGIEHGSVVADVAKACEDATVTMTFTHAEGYELTAWTVDGTEQELTATTFTMPNKDVEVSATFSAIVVPPAEATLKLMENGSEVMFEGNHKVGDVVTLPSALSDAEHACDGKVLKGWSSVAITTPVADKPEENFYELGDSYTIASEADVLYAVFAENIPGATTTTNIRYAGSTTTNMDGTNQAALLVDATDVTGWSVVGAKNHASNNVGLNKAPDMRLYGAANGGSTLTITAPQTITSVELALTEGYTNAYVEVGGNQVSVVDGVYPINATTFVIGNANTTTTQVRMTNIAVNFTAAGSVANYATSCVAPLADPTFSIDGGEYTSAQTITLSAEEGTIYYTLDGKTPTSASTQYEAEAPIVLNDCGTTTIKAIAISANNHSEVVSATYTLNIPLPTISEANPYTPAQAIEVFDGNCYNNEMVYVKGVVKTSSGLNTTYGNYDNIVVVAAETTAPEFTFFHMYKGAEKVQFDANDPAIAAGDTIVAYGELTKYGQIYEFKDGCYLIDRKAYDEPKQSIVNDLESAYTLAEAINFLENAAIYDLSDEVYVKGVATTAPNNYGTFNAHDPEAENVFQFYNTVLNELTVGVNDTIIVKGLIKKVNANYRMETGVVQQVTAYVVPVVPEFMVNPTAVAFGNVEQNAQVDAIELNVELTAIANATVTLADENGVFSIDKNALTETGVVTVSVVSTATVGEYAATITLHDVAEAAENVEISVSMNVTEAETRKIATITSFSSVSGDLNPSDITYAGYQGGAQNAPNASNKDNELRLYKYQTSTDFGGYVTIKAKTGCTIDQVVITVGGNANVGFSKNDAAIPTKESTPISLSTSDPFDSGTGLDADSIRVVNIDESNQFKIKTITVYYIGAPLPVDHYILGGTYETTFEQNTEFSYEGLTVTAAYDEQETITEAVTGFTVEADLSTAGAKKAEVMLNSVKIAEYDITVTPGKANPNLTYTPESETIPAAEVGTWVAPTLNNTLHVAPITYSSSKQAVATVDENGVIALAGGYGTAVITASFAGDDDNIASEATYMITVQEPVNKIAGKWMVAGAEDIKPGIKVIVVGEKSGTKYAMGAQNSNNRAAVAAQSIVVDTLYAAAGTKTFTLVDAGNGLYAFLANNGKYLYAASGSSNHLKEQDVINGNASWAIAIANDGEATIQAQGTNSRNLMSMTPNGNANPLFSCYKDEQSAIKLYVNRNQIDGSDDPTNPAEVAINDNVVEDEIVANGNVVVTVNTDNIEEPKSYIAQNGATIIITGTNPVAKNVVVEDGSRIEASVPTTTPTVYFATTMGSTQTPGTASELGTVTNITLAEGGEIIYDLTLGTSMEGIQADPKQWHAFTLPFAVDALNGIYDAETGAKLQNEVNYAIMDYHGDIRANGDYGWKKYRGILQPGVFYLMTVDGNTKTFRFKATQAGQMTQTTSMGYKAYNGSGDPSKDFGWNGIGNPSWVSGTVTVNVQVLDPYSYTYQPLTINTNITVSTPFFYNAGGDGSTGSVVMQNAGTGANYAPRRAPANEIEKIAVSFGNEVFRDKIYISASEDALNTYEQDKDLVRMIMSNTPKVAQIFGNAYGMKLAMVNAPIVNDQAEYSLTLYAPAAGEYTIAVPELENAEVYLTKDGAIIWNLSMGAYTAEFEKGNNEGYGLLLNAKMPMTPTGIEDVQGDKVQCTKVIINEHVYILRAEQMYDVTGKAVK